MERQLSEATANAATSWAVGEEAEKLSALQIEVREKERVISRLECQVEEQVSIFFFAFILKLTKGKN